MNVVKVTPLLDSDKILMLITRYCFESQFSTPLLNGMC